MRTWWLVVVAAAAVSAVAGQRELLEALDRLSERPDVLLFPGVSLRLARKTADVSGPSAGESAKWPSDVSGPSAGESAKGPSDVSGPSAGESANRTGASEASASVGERVLSRLEELASTRVLDVRVNELVNGARTLTGVMPRFNFGKNSFLTGFGLGFLAFGLKKLLLPLLIGAQIVKSVLLALFLPSIIGGIAKLMGKGLTTVAHSSSSSSPGAQHAHDAINDFDFKDPGGVGLGGGVGAGGYDSLGAGSGDDGAGVWTYPPAADAGSRQPFPAYTSSGVGASSAAAAALHKQPTAADRYHQKYTYGGGGNDHYGSKHNHNHIHPYAANSGAFYTKEKQQDFKVFHNMPASSQLLANYDPFYSPLLSRLDSVFSQLGQRDEACRERLVCDMYAAPARFAPYSNLVSAQLSRELNELRKPSSDNPEILRFFRYMRAAKEGQSGGACATLYGGCADGPTRALARPPMVTTFDDINKLVQARKLLR